MQLSMAILLAFLGITSVTAAPVPTRTDPLHSITPPATGGGPGILGAFPNPPQGGPNPQQVAAALAQLQQQQQQQVQQQAAAQQGAAAIHTQQQHAAQQQNQNQSHRRKRSIPRSRRIVDRDLDEEELD
ncbi:hypothetical protein CPB86DRAFT_829887 [Serendipita vermifera]|nr:hypothetical protein CPB86DRAFT_829887 [Serendipita vermifera]